MGPERLYRNVGKELQLLTAYTAQKSAVLITEHEILQDHGFENFKYPPKIRNLITAQNPVIDIYLAHPVMIIILTNK
jgi:hypothetical protein